MSSDASLLDRYKIIEQIGQGNFGTVTLVRCIEDNTLYVLKTVRLKGMKVDEQKGAQLEVCCLC